MLFKSEQFSRFSRYAQPYTLPLLLFGGSFFITKFEPNFISVLFPEMLGLRSGFIFPLISYSMLLLGVGLALDRYLRYGFPFSRRFKAMIDLEASKGREFGESEAILREVGTRSASEVDQKLKEIDSVLHDMRVLSTTEALDQTTQEELIELLTNRIEETSVQSITKQVIERASSRIGDTSLDQLHKQFRRSLSRMTDEVMSLGRRGNLNLVIGILATISGFIIFGFLVLDTGSLFGSPLLDTTDTATADPPKSESFENLLVSFVPRLSLVILIEIFAYFFLGLYKSSLTEIKYFQNEITNIEAKYLAIEQAIILGDKPTIKKLLDHISMTERNFILKKGESTTLLESEKLNAQQQTKLLDAVTKALVSLQDRPTKS